MAAIHGSIGPFTSSAEDWTSYSERLQQYFIANDVNDDSKQRAILLSNCGPQTYQLLKSLLTPDKPADKTFTEIVKKLKDYWQPKPSEIVQRFNFHSRVQKQGESVADYVAELRRISEHCNFSSLETMLRDQLVCGVRDSRIQKKLLAESTLDFKKAFGIAQAVETAEHQVKELHDSSTKPVGREIHRVVKEKKPVNTDQTCYRCGGTKHRASECRFKQATCRACGKVGHIAKVCRSKTKEHSKGVTPKPPARAHHITHSEQPTESTEYEEIFNITDTQSTAPYSVTILLNNSELEMEIDTGASVSLISKATYQNLWSPGTAPPIKPSKTNLRTYTGEQIQVIGQTEVEASVNHQTAKLKLEIVEGNGPSLLGKDWLRKLKLDWRQIFQVRADGQLQQILSNHKEVFQDTLGQIKEVKAKVYLKTDAKPKFLRARNVPWALRVKVEEELERLQKAGVIEPVRHSEWATPIVPVMKPNGDVRICGDYKATLNQAITTDSYPLPRTEDLFGSLSGGKSFSKVDLAHAYMQIPLDDETKKLTTINTHRGLFQYNRLPFGIASAPAIFQRTIETVLQGIPDTSVYIDDILVTGSTPEQHMKNLDDVLTRLEEAGLRLKQEKCQFLLPEVEYLGHVLSANGLKPSQKNIRAILAAPTPENVTQLKSFLGMVTYYLKFLPNLADTLSPLYSLLQKGSSWKWGKAQQTAFTHVKEQLSSPVVLTTYDPDKELILQCDASPYGVGAVLAHKERDGSERPIAYSSRTLAPVEKRYSQLDKEALALIHGVKKFHSYIYGRKFTLISDHKPLQHILGEKKGVPQMASARLQRWALQLGAYEYHIQYKPGKENSVADALSRLPLPDCPDTVPQPGETICLIESLQETPINTKQIAKWTARDPVLSRVSHLIEKGWTGTTDDDNLAPYKQRQNELSVVKGCVLWGSRVVVPTAGREKALQMLHEGHIGMSRMKSKARSMIWWPKIDLEIEKQCKECNPCQLTQHNPARTPCQSWDFPTEPWRRLHVDYAGPFMGKMLLIVVDAHSKWIDVEIVNSATAPVTVEKLRKIFATHGLPTTIVSDNGAVFTSEEFETFLKRNGIHHIRITPYHPASNGQAERAVQTVKEGLKRGSNGTLETKLNRFLFHYRTTPHSTTGVTPAQLLLGRKPRTHLDLMHPDIATDVQTKQDKQIEDRNKGTKKRELEINDRVYVRDLPTGSTWMQGKIIAKRGPRSYLVELPDGRVFRRHIDNLRDRATSSNSEEREVDDNDDWLDISQTEDNTESTETDHLPTPPPRRSTRNRQQTDWFAPLVQHT